MMVGLALGPVGAGLDKLTVQEWRDDLAYLAAEMPAIHSDLYELVSPERFAAAVEELYEAIPDLEPHEIATGLAKIVALAGDGHSKLKLHHPEPGFRRFPLVGYDFDDGFYILAAMPPYERTIGSKIERIGEHDVKTAFDALRPLLSAENDHFARSLFARQVMIPELLHALGLIPDIDHIHLTLRDSGGRSSTLTVEPVSIEEWSEWGGGRKISVRTDPAINRHPGERYWFTLLENSDTLYVQHNATLNQAGESFAEFVRRLEQFVDAVDFDRFVLDLRANSGGTANIAVPLIDLIGRHPKINRRGRLFTIIGRSTYSAAVLAAGMLENRTRTLFVGEPTGQGTNLFGDAKLIRLPNSWLDLTISRRWWQCSVADDPRRWIEPDIRVPVTHADYMTRQDAALEAILNHRNLAPPTAPQTAEQAARYTGRYLFSPYQVLTVERTGNRLSFGVADVVDGPDWLGVMASSLYPVAGDRFLTDISGVTLRAAPAWRRSVDALTFDWHGVEKTFPRVPDDYAFPIELIDGGNIAGGANGPRIPNGLRDEVDLADDATVAGAVDRLLEDQDEMSRKIILEPRLNLAGYRFLRSGRYETAQRIFQANVDLFPRSWNVYDSLGEAYRYLDDRDQAVRNYRKSLELWPANGNAMRALREMRAF
jgi:hypothetical protein